MSLPAEKLTYNSFYSTKSRIVIFCVLCFVLISFFILDILLGSVRLSISDIVQAVFSNGSAITEQIISQFRIPKAITAVLVGISLSVCGLQMQTLFRNPMAGPYVLGVSSGASLGVALVVLGFSPQLMVTFLPGLGNWVLVIAAWIGAAAVLILIFLIASKVREIMTILIIGIMLASGISAIVTILQYFSNESMLKAYVVWTMGSLGNLSGGQLGTLAISVSLGLFLSIFTIKMLNALLLGETYASSLGLDIKKSRILIFLCTSILAGSVTAFCGPIGFIGIAVPHIVRNIFRTSDHKVLIPGVILTGASIMLISDIISQLPGSDKVLPVNSVTSLIGIPVVIWVILKNRKGTAVF